MKNAEYKELRKQYIGQYLRHLRRDKDKTLAEVAKAVGLKENTISAYERGVISIPLDNLDDICTYLGVDYLDFLSDVNKQMQDTGRI